MLKDNLVMLRNIHGFSQEAIAEKIGISRQAYAKWVRPEPAEGAGMIPPAPKGKNIWGTVAVNDRGQIVIPKGARDRFGLTGGQRLIVLSDEQGIALIPDEAFMANLTRTMELMEKKGDE